MTDRAKEVAEIAKDYDDIRTQSYRDYIPQSNMGIAYYFANALADMGYRKIPKDAVVLSRETYNELRSRPTNCTYIDISKDFAKECQKEIENAVNERTIEIIKDLIGHRFAYYVKDETNGTVTCCADYVVDEDDVKFLKEKYKVEVKK